MWPSSSGDSTRQRPIRITVRDLDAERGPPPPPPPPRLLPPPSSSSSSSSSSSAAAAAATPAATVAASSSRGESATSAATAAGAAGGGDAPPLSMGWLLRLFRSDFFDAWMAVTYLYRYRSSRGVHDYLCNELYHLSDADLEAFLPQVCNLLVHHARDSPALERFVMDKCASSLHFAVQVYWFLQAAVEDAVRDANKDAEARCRLLRTRCETAAVNGIRFAQHILPASVSSLPASVVPSAATSTTPSPLSARNDGGSESPFRWDSSQGPPPASPSPSARESSAGTPLGNSYLPRYPADAHRPHVLHRRPSIAEREMDAYLRTPASDAAASLDDVAKAGVAMTATTKERSGANSKEGTEDTQPPSLPSVVVPDDSDDGRPNVATPSVASDAATVGDPDDLHRGDIGELDVESEKESREGGHHVSAENGDSERGINGTGGYLTAEEQHVEDSLAYLSLAQKGSQCMDPASHPLSAKAEGVEDPSGTAHMDKALAADFDPVALLTMKQERFDYFNDSLTIVKAFVRLSLSLREVPNDDRPAKLKSGLREANEILRRRMAGEPSIPLLPGAPAPQQDYVSRLGMAAALRSIHLPLSRAMSPALRILRVIVDDAIILTSRTRVPYMLFVEVLPTNMLCCDQYLFCHHIIADMEAKGLPVPEHMVAASEHGPRLSGQTTPSSKTTAATPNSEERKGTPSTAVLALGQALAETAGAKEHSSPAPSSDVNATSASGSGANSPASKRPLGGDTTADEQKSTSSLQASPRASAPARLGLSSSGPALAAGSGSCGDAAASPRNGDARLEPSSSAQARSRHVSSTLPGGHTRTQSVSSRGSLDMTPAERQRANVYSAIYGQALHVVPFMDLDIVCPEVPDTSAVPSPESTRAVTSDAANKSREAALLAVYGELWSWKEERILGSSPFHGLRGLKLMPFIVKAGDDLRQEQLAIQLISQFQWIFAEESIDVYVRPFTVMSVSSDAGFVEVIPDAVSIHSLKKRTPNFISLLDYFERAYGSIGSRSFREAQRRFIRSMAGYSLVSYFLQIKDRHNGNIMLNAEGHIIHIDFGFMLTNSPGAIKFENVPFKLTEEYLQVICARKSVQDAAEASRTEGYRYFQELFVLGLLAARKHYEKLTTLVEIMMEGTSMPCMSGGHSVVESLRHRFCLGVSEEHCIKLALGLIDESRLSWRSASYDKFQQMQNGYC